MKKPKLNDAHLLHKENPKTFEIPSDAEIAEIKNGSMVKVANKWERFWVRVDSIKGDTYTGKVANILFMTSGYTLGDTIEFKKKNIYSIQ